jgi:hypothetical protein
MAARTLPACQSGTRHPDTWHSHHPDQQAEARAVCLACPTRPACQTAVLAAEAGLPAADRHGIWAALDGDQRADLDPTTPATPASGGRPLANCGSFSAYRRHARNNQPIDPACQEAARQHWADERATAKTREAAA